MNKSDIPAEFGKVRIPAKLLEAISPEMLNLAITVARWRGEEMAGEPHTQQNLNLSATFTELSDECNRVGVKMQRVEDSIIGPFAAVVSANIIGCQR